MINIISIGAKGRCELYELFHKEVIPYEVKKNVITTSFAKITFLNECNVTKESLEEADIVCGFVFNKKPLKLAEDTNRYAFERVDSLVAKLKQGTDVEVVYKVCTSDEHVKVLKTIVPRCDLKFKLKDYIGSNVKYFLTEEKAHEYVRKYTEDKINEFEKKIEFLKKQKFEILFETR